MTPFQYLGVHSNVFEHGAKKAIGKAKGLILDLRNDLKQTASATTKQPATRGHKFRRGLLAAGGALATAAAVAGAVYSKREEIKNWVTDHVDYVENLWRKAELNERLNTIVGYDKNMDILFRM